MRTEDHYLLAVSLTSKEPIEWLNRQLFLLGNILPDYNRFTYLGPRSQYFSHGHSFKARRWQFRHFLHERPKDTPLWWFRAGHFFHYVADSFTRPHNPEFCYNSPAHIAYEKRLKKIFARKLLKKPWPDPEITGDPYEWLMRRHAAYMHHSKDLTEDCFYICTTTQALFQYLFHIMKKENQGLT